MTEFWIGGIPQKPHLKIFEIIYGEPYRSISSLYENESHFWFIFQEKGDNTAFSKMTEIRVKIHEKTGETTFDSPFLPAENLNNPERHFISSYNLTTPGSSDAIVQQYIDEAFTSIFVAKLVTVDVNQLVTNNSGEQQPFREAIKTLPTTKTVSVTAVIKPIITSVVEGVTTRVLDEENKREIKVEFSGLGFTEEQMETEDIEIILDDLLINIS